MPWRKADFYILLAGLKHGKGNHFMLALHKTIDYKIYKTLENISLLGLIQISEQGDFIVTSLFMSPTIIP